MMNNIKQFVLDTMSDKKYLEQEEHPLENVSSELRTQILTVCAFDPKIFILLLRVPSPEGYIPIIPYEKQKEIIDTVIDHHYLILLGSRQTGKTTIIQSIIVWLLLFFKKYKVGILMQKDDSVKDFIAETMKLYESLPTWIKSELTVDNTKEKILANGSKLQGAIIDPKNPSGVGRGLRVDFLVIDEAAFINKIDKAYTALKPATGRRHLKLKKAGLPYGTVIISTPNGTTGTGEWFYNQWVKAESGQSTFKAIRFHWKEVPEYDDEWFKIQTSDMNLRDINQEYELKFIGSSSAYLDDQIIEKIQDERFIKDPIKEIPLQFGKFYLYKEINNNTVYFLGADSADSGKDYASMILFDYVTEEVVGIYYNQNVASTDFAQDTYMLCEYIPNSLLIFEKNGLGTASVQMLYRELGPTRVFVHNESKRFKPDSYKYAGIATTGPSRKLMFNSLEKYVKNNYDKLNSKELIYELISLEIKGSRIEAADNAHDDLVMALNFCLYVLEHTTVVRDYIPKFGIKQLIPENEIANMELIASLNSDNFISTESSQYSGFNNNNTTNFKDMMSIKSIINNNIQQNEEVKNILSDIFNYN